MQAEKPTMSTITELSNEPTVEDTAATLAQVVRATSTTERQDAVQAVAEGLIAGEAISNDDATRLLRRDIFLLGLENKRNTIGKRVTGSTICKNLI